MNGQHDGSVVSQALAWRQQSQGRQRVSPSPGVRRGCPLSLGSLARTLAFKLGVCPSSDLGFTWFLESNTINAKKHIGGNVVQFVVPSFGPLKADLGSSDTYEEWSLFLHSGGWAFPALQVQLKFGRGK